MVIGGGPYQKQTEVMDLTDTNITCKTTYRDLESQREYAVGGLINETPIVCGGRNLPEYYDSCITFGQTKTSIKMNEPRSSAASVVLNETTLWIMGGLAGRSRRLKSTELITLDPATSVNGPALPKALAGSCAVKYNDTHIYLTGSSNQVWIYNTMLNPGSSSWTEGPRMNNARGYHGCTVLHHDQRSWLVLAGGLNDDDAFKSMEILDPNKNKWVQGENIKNDFPFFSNNVFYEKLRLILLFFFNRTRSSLST